MRIPEKILPKNWSLKKKQKSRKSSIYGSKEEFDVEDTKKPKEDMDESG